MKRNIFIIAAVMLCGVSFAQKDTLRAVVNIASDYTPMTIPVKKMNFTPEAVDNAARRTPEIVFSESSMPFSGFVSEKSTKEVTHKAQQPYNGYVRAGYGVINELDAKAACSYDITSRDNVNAFASIDGYKRALDGEIHDWKSRFYNTMFGFNYSHRFNYLKLDVDAGLGNMVFNYQDAGFNNGHTDKQNSMEYRFGIRGASSLSGPFAYTFKAGYTHNTRKYSSDARQRISENRIIAGGTLSCRVDDSELEKFGIDLDVNTFLYNRALRNSVNGYKDYVSVNVDPYLDFNFFGWKFRLGTSMNVITANGPVFSIAPDLRLRKDFSNSIALFASVAGGREDNTFAKMQSLTPYWGHEAATSWQLKPTYRVVDLLVGSSYTLEPLSVEVTAGYAYTKDDMLQTMVVSQNAYIYTNFAQQNTHNAHAFARVGYDFGGWFKVSGDARYDFWHGANKDLLVLKPEITCNVNAELRLFRNLTLNAGYNFTRYTRSELGKRVGLKNDLNAKIAYQFTPWIGAYIQGENLLNDSYYDYAGYFARGARGVIGVSANF